MSSSETNPIVSIIVPVYNVEEYLDKCIQSLINQTLQDIEIILVNDGSTDSSSEICDRYKSKDDRIIVIHKKNGGLSSARNEGLRIARGEYIGFVDSDDYIELSTYEKLLNGILTYRSDISICGRIVENNNKSKVEVVDGSRDTVLNSKEVIKRILLKKGIFVAAWDKLYKKELFDNEEFPVGKVYEDIFLIPKIILKTDKIVCIKEAMYHYLIRNQSITQENYNKRSYDVIENSELLYHYILKNYPDYCDEARYFYYENILSCYSKYVSSDRITKNKFIQDEFNIKRKMRIHIFSLIKNPYPTKTRKIQYILIYLGFSKLKKYLGGRKNEKNS